MRKKLAVLLTLVLIFCLSVMGTDSQNKAYAKNAQMYLEVPDSVKKENEITVKVILDSDVELYSVDAYLSYSAEMLEFVPDNEFVTGADGVLELKDIYGEETKKAEYEITFKALETGSAEVGLTDVYLIDYTDLEYITVAPSVKHFEIGINKKVEEDARLSELIVAPGDLTEEFNPDQLEYEMHVGLDVEHIGISATPMDEESVVGLEMPETLQDGENLVIITVTALSGNVNTYTIRVIRQDWPEEMNEETVAEPEETMEGAESVENTEQTSETEVTTESTQQESSTEIPVTETATEEMEMETEDDMIEKITTENPKEE